MDDARQVPHVAHQIAVLRDRHRDAGDIRFLERIGADRCRGDVSGYDHQRHGIHVGRGDAGHQVRRPRTEGRDADADFACRPGIAVRRVNRALFMAGQQMVEVRVAIHRIINVQHGAARIAEHAFDAFQQQAAQQNFRTGDLVRLQQFFANSSFDNVAKPSTAMLILLSNLNF